MLFRNEQDALYFLIFFQFKTAPGPDIETSKPLLDYVMDFCNKESEFWRKNTLNKLYFNFEINMGEVCTLIKALASTDLTPLELLVSCAKNCVLASTSFADRQDLFPSTEIAIFSNPRLPKHIIEDAATGRKYRRIAAAENPSCPKEILSKLCEDSNRDVIYSAIENPNTTEEARIRGKQRLTWLF